jgi:hypothetical protein
MASKVGLNLHSNLHFKVLEKNKTFFQFVFFHHFFKKDSQPLDVCSKPKTGLHVRLKLPDFTERCDFKFELWREAAVHNLLKYLFVKYTSFNILLSYFI